MATTFNCDRCGDAMGTSPDAEVKAFLAQGVESKLRGPERAVQVDLCRRCFYSLRDFLYGGPTTEIPKRAPDTP